jgi:hypothetical protein
MKTEIRKFLESKIKDYNFGEHWRVVFFDEGECREDSYNIDELMEEFAQQNTLNRDKVMDELNMLKWIQTDKGKVIFSGLKEDDYEEFCNRICSLSLPTLSEGEIRNIIFAECKAENDAPIFGITQAAKAIKKLTKPKEER